jgi:hypothetical protein
LSDCTSQYHLFDDCSFEKSSLNAEAIGLTFGLNRENLQSLDLVWRGEDLARPQGGHRPEDLVTTYLARRWNFAASIVKLNFGIGSSLEALGEVFSTVRQSFSSSMPIRRDELNFLAAVIDRLSAVGQLPFLAIAAGLDVVAASSEMNDGRYALNLRGLFHSLKEAEHLALGVLEETVAPLLQADRSEEVMSVCFHFVDVPTHSFGQWLSDMHSAGLFSGPIPVFRYSAKGSYLEYFYMAPGTLAGILICLNLVERIIDKMISIRARTGVLSSKKLSPVIRRKALQPVAAVSPALLKELRFYLDFARGPRGPRMIADIQEFGQQLTNIEVDDGSA